MDTTRVDPDLERIQESVAWLIRLGEFHRFHRGEVGDGPVLDRTAFLLLSRLDGGASLTMGEIATLLDLSPSTATRRVAPLVAAGLLSRSRHPDSHRTVAVGITDAGRARVGLVRQARVRTLRETFRDWDPVDLSTLAELMTRLTDTLEVELPQDDHFSDRRLRG